MVSNKMKIAVISGKGGTGKTLVSINLAAVAKKAVYIDCDVEEPNGHLFFRPENIKSEKVNIKIPYVNEADCVGCRKCIDFCKFNALAYIKNKVVVFEEVCHSCGGCVLFCPEKALAEKDKCIGEIEKGTSQDVTVISGIMNTGEQSGVPIIKKMMKYNEVISELTFIDSPPGSSCIVMESIKDVDYCILVAEPTLFGVHNLNMVYNLVKVFNKPLGVVLNKCLDGENPAEKYCIENDVKIIGKIPFDTELGKMNSDALVVSREREKYYKIFYDLLKDVTREVSNEKIINS